MTLKGKIEDSLLGHGALAHDYFDFLQATQPATRWADLGALPEPIEISDAYPIDWKLARRWAASCPSLSDVLEEVELFDTISVLLGWQYAWTRFQQHKRLLDVIESRYFERPPKLILEPGCFTGGILHFLAARWPSTPCVGFDISPVALDVCVHYSHQLPQYSSPLWLEANFCLVQPANLPESLRTEIAGGLVIMCNAIEALGKAFDSFPYAERWSLRARLISYWVNLGSTVLLCERHPDLDLLADTIVQGGHWAEEGCRWEIASRFKATTTVEMTVDNPMGDWVESECGVLCFSPPRHN